MDLRTSKDFFTYRVLQIFQIIFLLWQSKYYYSHFANKYFEAQRKLSGFLDATWFVTEVVLNFCLLIYTSQFMVEIFGYIFTVLWDPIGFSILLELSWLKMPILVLFCYFMFFQTWKRWKADLCRDSEDGWRENLFSLWASEVHLET